MNTGTLPWSFDHLDQALLRNAWWRVGQVMQSGLAAGDKSLLVLLVRLDPEGQGVEASWEQLAAATSLSVSSVRRAGDRLRLVEVLAWQRRKAPDDLSLIHI